MDSSAVTSVIRGLPPVTPPRANPMLLDGTDSSLPMPRDAYLDQQYFETFNMHKQDRLQLISLMT